jgi:GntR family transcriptional regulator
VEELLLSSTMFPGLESVALEHASLSAIVRERYLLEPIDGEQRFSVARCPPAIAHALELKPRQSTLLIERTLNFPGAPGAIFSRLYCRTDRVTLSQQLGSPTL